jgi:hypothetical protein
MPRAKAAPKPADDSDDAPLKRLGGGRWQTRDERFTIEPQSGTWVVVDAEQTDDFGMPLVRGPYPSLTAAKGAISSARGSEPAASPLAERIERRRTEPEAGETAPPEAKPTSRRRPGKDATAEPAGDAPRAAGTARATKRKPAVPEEPAEPAWLTDLEPAERGRARRLIARLEEAGHDDAVSIVRRDVLGDVPAVAARAIGKRLAELGDDASPQDVAELLADGHDDRLDVRWRLVDGAGRPIVIERVRPAPRH